MTTYGKKWQTPCCGMWVWLCFRGEMQTLDWRDVRCPGEGCTKSYAFEIPRVDPYTGASTVSDWVPVEDGYPEMDEVLFWATEEKRLPCCLGEGDTHRPGCRFHTPCA